VLSLIEVKGVLKVKVEVEAFFLSSALARLRAPLMRSSAFISASLTFLSISGFKF
jgi:hypothetical protein